LWGSAPLLQLVWAVVAIFLPKRGWRFVMGPEDVNHYIEDHDVSTNGLHRAVARDYRDMFNGNKRKLTFHNSALVFACVFLIVQLVAFVIDLRR
jgi:hypothetical protein